MYISIELKNDFAICIPKINDSRILDMQIGMQLKE